MIGIPLNKKVPFGQTTERFFVEGEQHEAQQWQDVVLPPDDEPEPKRQRGSVDRVPRQRGAIVALALFAICLVLGLGFGASALLKTGLRLDSFLSLFKASPPSTLSTVEPARPAAPTNSPPTRPQVEPLPSELSQPPATPPTPSEVQPQPQARLAAQGAGLAQEDTTSGENEADPPPKAEKTNSESVAKPKAHRGRHPHDNYIWSQEANALVPATSVADPDTNPPRQEPRAVQRQSARNEQTPLSPPRLHESTIAPATTGEPTTERPAPNNVSPFEQ